MSSAAEEIEVPELRKVESTVLLKENSSSEDDLRAVGCSYMGYVPYNLCINLEI